MSPVSRDTMRVVWAALNRTGRTRAEGLWAFAPDRMAAAAALADHAATAAAAGDADTARMLAHEACAIADDTEHAQICAF